MIFLKWVLTQYVLHQKYVHMHAYHTRCSVMWVYPATLGVYTDVGDYTGQTCWHAVPGHVHGGWALFRKGVVTGFYGMACCRAATCISQYTGTCNAPVLKTPGGLQQPGTQAMGIQIYYITFFVFRTIEEKCLILTCIYIYHMQTNSKWSSFCSPFGLGLPHVFSQPQDKSFALKFVFCLGIHDPTWLFKHNIYRNADSDTTGWIHVFKQWQFSTSNYRRSHWTSSLFSTVMLVTKQYPYCLSVCYQAQSLCWVPRNPGVRKKLTNLFQWLPARPLRNGWWLDGQELRRNKTGTP